MIIPPTTKTLIACQTFAHWRRLACLARSQRRHGDARVAAAQCRYWLSQAWALQSGHR